MNMKLGPNKMGHCYKPAPYHSYKAKIRKDKTRWIGNVHFEYDSISLNAIFNIDDIKSMPAFPKTTVWHNTSSNEVVYGDHNEELPF